MVVLRFLPDVSSVKIVESVLVGVAVLYRFSLMKWNIRQPLSRRKEVPIFCYCPVICYITEREVTDGF